MQSARINPSTVEALLDTTWRVAASEDARTDALDQKAAGVSSFAALVLSLTATLGGRTLGIPRSGPLHVATLVLFLAGLTTLVGAVVVAVRALWPTERLTLGMAYLERFPTWAEIVKTPEQVRGDTMLGLVRAVARERAVNKRKALAVRRAFGLLLAGLVFIAADASILAIREF